MDDLEQRVARALCKAHYGLGETELCVAHLDRNWTLWVEPARAIIPMVLEEAAQEVDGCCQHCDRKAAAIRAMGAP